MVVVEAHGSSSGTFLSRLRSLRRRFVGVGLLPSLYEMRRLPLGIWLEVAALVGIATVTLGLAVLATRPRPVARQLWRLCGLAAAVATGAYCMFLLARGDARTGVPVADDLVSVIVIAVQAGIAVASVRLARRADPATATALTIAFGAVLATSAVLVAVGQRLPAVVAVVAIVVVAARFARLPLDPAARSRGSVTISTTGLYVWTVVVLALQTGTLERPYGLATAIAGMTVGSLTIGVLGAGPALRRWVQGFGALLAGSTLLALLFVLVPSEASLEWLIGRGFSAPSRFELRDEVLTASRYELWFDTEQAADAALVDAHLGMGRFVSEWTGALGNGIDGHLFGYHLDVRVWAAGSGTTSGPTRHRCRRETRTCVLVVLRRSDDHESTIPFEPLVLPDVDPHELSPPNRMQATRRAAPGWQSPPRSARTTVGGEAPLRVG